MSNYEDQFKREYMLEIPKDTKPYYTCMDCDYFIGGACSTSAIEAKYGSGKTPACSDDFKLKEK
jgi:hypothetical protein